MKFEQDVRDEVAALLQKLLDSCDIGDPSPSTYKAVLDRLSRMAILGTAPPACRPKQNHETQLPSKAVRSYDDDFSERKESFIAP